MFIGLFTKLEGFYQFLAIIIRFLFNNNILLLWDLLFLNNFNFFIVF